MAVDEGGRRQQVGGAVDGHLSSRSISAKASLVSASSSKKCSNCHTRHSIPHAIKEQREKGAEGGREKGAKQQKSRGTRRGQGAEERRGGQTSRGAEEEQRRIACVVKKYLGWVALALPQRCLQEHQPGTNCTQHIR